MRPARSLAALAVVAPLALVVLAAHSPAEDPPKVSLEAVKYDTYLARIAANKKAKITMVDGWATWCGVCMENFPHVVEMHKKYASKGLAVVSLSLDDATEPKDLATVKKFLEAKGATFTNFILNEEPTDAFEKLKVGTMPAVFFFGPDGKEIARFTHDDPENAFTYDEIEEAAKALLEGKPVPKKKK